MKFNRGVWAGVSLLLALSGCSDKGTLNVEGSYSPVIGFLASDREPAVRGEANVLTARVTNPRGYALRFHWFAANGALADTSDGDSVATWTAPDTLGSYPITVSVAAHDDLNNVDFFTVRTIPVTVDNEYIRWTRAERLQFDVTPPIGGNLYYSEIRSAAAGTSDIWALDAPLGTPTKITLDFHTATSPTVRADVGQLAFLGKRRQSDPGPSIYLISPSGGDTTTAVRAVTYRASNNGNLNSPRFAPTGNFLMYSSDTTSFGNPRPWIRDAANLLVAPFRLMPAFTEFGTSYILGNWSGLADSVVFQSFQFFGQSGQAVRGLFKMKTTVASNFGGTPFIADSRTSEPDWSPDGRYIVFAYRAIGRADRDLYIAPTNATDMSAALPITRGPADDSHPRFSSDGNTVYFISNRADRYGNNGVFETERRGTNIWSVTEFDRP